MKKPLAILTTILIALLTIGYSYARWSNRININPNKNFNIAFINTLTSDNEAEMDVAAIHAQITPDQNTINIYIINAYPSYEAYVTYTIKNIGKIPSRFDSLTIKNPNPEALEITTTDYTHTWLQPDQTLQGTITIRILQKANENQAYPIQIIMGFSCKEEKPRSIGFWKQQLLAALTQSESQLQIAPATLEHYLNQISTQSPIYEFTGDREQKFQQALNILDLLESTTMEAKLKAQLLALWLNYIAGWTEGYTSEGMTAEDIIEGSENAITEQLTGKYEYWKNLCEKFNNLAE